MTPPRIDDAPSHRDDRAGLPSGSGTGTGTGQAGRLLFSNVSLSFLELGVAQQTGTRYMYMRTYVRNVRTRMYYDTYGNRHAVSSEPTRKSRWREPGDTAVYQCTLSPSAPPRTVRFERGPRRARRDDATMLTMPRRSSTGSDNHTRQSLVGALSDRAMVVVAARRATTVAARQPTPVGQVFAFGPSKVASRLAVEQIRMPF